MSGVLGSGHPARVRALYKAILRLHKGMPPELQEIGDKYVKEEFKRHKDAEAPFVVVFMKEWANYAYTLAKQLEVPETKEQHKFGKVFGVKDLELLTEDQTLQLVELFKETHPGVMKEEPVTAAPSDGVKDVTAAGGGSDSVPPIHDLSAAETNKTGQKDHIQTVTNQDKPR